MDLAFLAFIYDLRVKNTFDDNFVITRNGVNTANTHPAHRQDARNKWRSVRHGHVSFDIGGDVTLRGHTDTFDFTAHNVDFIIKTKCVM